MYLTKTQQKIGKKTLAEHQIYNVYVRCQREKTWWTSDHIQKYFLVRKNKLYTHIF